MGKTLASIPKYPQEKIPPVQDAVAKCSFTKGIMPDLLESKILQDADGLESTGAISIMCTFASTGKMQRKFFHPTDPFSEHRQPEPKQSALDLFFFRLLKVKDRMHTATAKKSPSVAIDSFIRFLMRCDRSWPSRFYNHPDSLRRIRPSSEPPLLRCGGVTLLKKGGY